MRCNCFPFSDWENNCNIIRVDLVADYPMTVTGVRVIRQPKCNEFSKLSTKSCMSRTMNNLNFSYHEGNNNRNNNIQNDDFISRYTYVRYVV